eukprot:SAG31_NODE_2064_length_6532_cov_3.118918_5_plen_491_part_00
MIPGLAMAALAIIVALSAAAPASAAVWANDSHCSSVPTRVTEAAAQVCSAQPIHAALRIVQVPAKAVVEAEQLMAALGFETMLDLQLLAQAPAEAEELMSELSVGGLALAHRAKVRLLFRSHGCSPATSRPTDLYACDDRQQLDGQRHTESHGPSPSQFLATATSAGNNDDSSARRREQGGDGMTADTIAIVASILVGAAGYLVQAWTARRAELAAAAAAQEQRVAEAGRERLQQQMTAQIKRSERSLDECCVPVRRAIAMNQHSVNTFVAEAVLEMERTNSELLAPLLERTKGFLAVSDDGTQLISKRTGLVVWDAATVDGNRFMRLETRVSRAKDSAASCTIATFHIFALLSQPYACELPQAIIEYIAADPTTVLAQSYRLFVRHSFLPPMLEAARLLWMHSAFVERPPLEWLKVKFPEEFWQGNSGGLYLDSWDTRAKQWEVLVAKWDAGNHSEIVPNSNLCPYGGVFETIKWAITRGHERQRELIG